MKNPTALIIVSLLFALPSAAQERLTEHTLTRGANFAAPKATVADMAWLEGAWEGPAFGGLSTEIWSNPAGGAMVGMYRLTVKGKVVFYELQTIVEDNGSLLMRLKHFHPTLVGWEEKEKTVDFPFIGVRDGIIHFDGIAYRPGRDHFTVWLALQQKGGAFEEEVFEFRRIQSKEKQ